MMFETKWAMRNGVMELISLETQTQRLFSGETDLKLLVNLTNRMNEIFKFLKRRILSLFNISKSKNKSDFI